MRDMTDARQRFSAKAISPQLAQILERLDLGRGEAFAQDWKVVLLLHLTESAGALPSSSTEESLTLIPDPLSCICSSLIPPSLTVTRIVVEPASSAFSISSFRALAGRWMICHSTRISADRREGARTGVPPLQPRSC